MSKIKTLKVHESKRLWLNLDWGVRWVTSQMENIKYHNYQREAKPIHIANLNKLMVVLKTFLK